eukprot:Nk52_evm43s2579 gene=Nk52_evmTU43s2579
MNPHQHRNGGDSHIQFHTDSNTNPQHHQHHHVTNNNNSSSSVNYPHHHTTSSHSNNSSHIHQQLHQHNHSLPHNNNNNNISYVEESKRLQHEQEMKKYTQTNVIHTSAPIQKADASYSPHKDTAVVGQTVFASAADGTGGQGQPVVELAGDYDIFQCAQRGLLDKIIDFVEIKKAHLITDRDSGNVTLLHWAAINNRLACAEYLLKNGHEVDAIGGDLQATPLQWAARQGHSGMCVLLMKEGADPTIKDCQGFNSLHLAAQFGHDSLCAYFVAKGVDVNSVDDDGRTALMWSAYRLTFSDVPLVLIKLNADVTVLDRTNNSAVHWAATQGHCSTLNCLLKYGGEGSLGIRNENGLTPLECAQTNHQTDCVRRLMWISPHSSKVEYPKNQFLKRMTVEQRQNFTHPSFFVIMPVLGMIVAFCPIKIGFPLFLAAIVAFTVYLKALWVPFDKSVTVFALFTGTYFWLVVSYLVFLMPAFYYYTESVFLFLVQAVVFLGLAYKCTLSFYQAWRHDPGYLRPSPKEQYEAIIKFTEHGDDDHVKWCNTCLLFRPLRAKHCGMCDACVAKFDHHCPFVGNCVGANNHKPFMWYIVTLDAMAFMYIYATYGYLRVYENDNASQDFIPWALEQCHYNSFIVFLFIVVCFHCTWISFLVISQLWQVSRAVTTNESMNMHKYTIFHTGKRRVYKNPFNRGLIHNCADFWRVSFGSVKPKLLDWKRQFDVTSFQRKATSYNPLAKMDAATYAETRSMMDV